MPKVTLKMDDFKALASDSRLEIIKALDGKKMGLKELSNSTNLNKMTLHEHLSKLVETGFVKRIEREGHKWVYYKLTWKGESLIHPENTKVVLLFCSTIFTFIIGIYGFVNVLKNYLDSKKVVINEPTKFPPVEPIDKYLLFGQDPILVYLVIICFIIFTILLFFTIRKYKQNKKFRFNDPT